MAGANPDGSNLLSELEAQLRAPDSIMEPGVLDLLKDYLRAGGKPSAAIEDLSENYEGGLPGTVWHLSTARKEPDSVD